MKPTRENVSSLHHKKPRSAGISILIYDRMLHPELVATDTCRVRPLGEFDVRMWLLSGGGHMVAVSGPHTLCELACFPNKLLPDRGLIERLPCKGDKQYDLPMGERYHYYLALNEEHVTDALFENSVAELLRIAGEQDGLVSQRRNEMGQIEYLSVLVAQLHRRAVHLEGFHLLGEARVLVRTQSIIEPSGH